MLIPDISRLRRGRRGVTDNWNVLSEAAKNKSSEKVHSHGRIFVVPVIVIIN